MITGMIMIPGPPGLPGPPGPREQPELSIWYCSNKQQLEPQTLRPAGPGCGRTIRPLLGVLAV
jgi:hypothetical protein